MRLASMRLSPCAAITPLLLTAPRTCSAWLPAAYRLPLFSTSPALVARLPPANTLPDVLFSFATDRLASPLTAWIWPRVLSASPLSRRSLPPAARVASVLSSTPVDSTTSMAETMRPFWFCTLPACTVNAPLLSSAPPRLSSPPLTCTPVAPWPLCARLPPRLSKVPALMLSCPATVRASRWSTFSPVSAMAPLLMMLPRCKLICAPPISSAPVPACWIWPS
ncbi:hypothetical protein D3C81_805310 [compost metagenome]